MSALARSSNEDIRRALRERAGHSPSWLTARTPGALTEQIMHFDFAGETEYYALLVDLVDRFPGAESNHAVEMTVRASLLDPDNQPEWVPALRFDSEAGALGVTCAAADRGALEALCDYIDAHWPRPS